MASSQSSSSLASWLGAAVAAKSSIGWLHGQVRAIDAPFLVVDHGNDETTKCRASTAQRVDPIIALLLWDHTFPPRTSIASLLDKHALLLNNLLSDTSTRPSRVLGKVTDGALDPTDSPAPSATRTWLAPSGTVHSFPLQHAVDFVYVNESSAHRVPANVRASVGADFFLVPASVAVPTGAQRSCPDVSHATTAPAPRGKRRASALVSLYGSSGDEAAADDSFSDASDANVAYDQVGGVDAHARITALLRNYPDLLSYHNARTPKRSKVSAVKDQDKVSKYAFKPSLAQQRVHATLTSPVHAGMSPSEFIDCLIAHPAVQFAPHPGTLTRLYAFEFGTRGLSIMHLAWLNQLDKIQWAMDTSVNMQKFSAAVALPPCGIHISPFGAVPKGDDGTDIRLIHDLSFPYAASVNDYTVKASLPSIVYVSVSRLAAQIEELARSHPGVRILMLKGDVNAAFRHLRQHASDVRWMGGILPSRRAAVLDLSAPFGWTRSPALYGVFGRAISFLVASESPASMHPTSVDAAAFFAYEWVDDHIMVEPDVANRCTIAEDTLRLAMLAILGPAAINEAKFTSWSTTVRALGLDWNTVTRSGLTGTR